MLRKNNVTYFVLRAWYFVKLLRNDKHSFYINVIQAQSTKYKAP